MVCGSQRHPLDAVASAPGLTLALLCTISLGIRQPPTFGDEDARGDLSFSSVNISLALLRVVRFLRDMAIQVVLDTAQADNRSVV
jgi:hypothetical protein